MAVTDPDLSWADPSWREPSDNPWQRTLRLQQAWWRQERARLPAGPQSGGARLVNSMLPTGSEWEPNLITPEAVASAELAVETLAAEKRPGLIQLDRLHRNLLSSQPMCFNLFGYLSAYPNALLPWVISLQPSAVSVEKVMLEWAPAVGTISGSAFDAFVSYRTGEGRSGFIGVECKYAENLAKAQPHPAAAKHKTRTTDDLWAAGAAGRLDRPRLRQLWFNQLLTQDVARSGDFVDGIGVVVACSDDQPARDAVADVATELRTGPQLRFSPISDVVNSVEGHDSWRVAFTERYLTYSQIDARLAELRADHDS